MFRLFYGAVSEWTRWVIPRSAPHHATPPHLSIINPNHFSNLLLINSFLYLKFILQATVVFQVGRDQKRWNFWIKFWIISTEQFETYRPKIANVKKITYFLTESCDSIVEKCSWYFPSKFSKTEKLRTKIYMICSSLVQTLYLVGASKSSSDWVRFYSLK